MSQSQSDTEDETEFVTEDIPIVKRTANLKGRQQGLARARETKVRKQKVIKNVMEVHKEINKAKSLTERATTSINKAKSRAAEEGIEIPTIAPPAPAPAPAPAQDQNAAMLKMMELMANEIRTLKAPPPVPVVVEPKPKPKATPKPKKEEAPPPVNIAAPAMSMTPHQVRMNEQSLRIDNLRKALGRN